MSEERFNVTYMANITNFEKGSTKVLEQLNKITELTNSLKKVRIGLNTSETSLQLTNLSKKINTIKTDIQSINKLGINPNISLGVGGIKPANTGVIPAKPTIVMPNGTPAVRQISDEEFLQSQIKRYTAPVSEVTRQFNSLNSAINKYNSKLKDPTYDEVMKARWKNVVNKRDARLDAIGNVNNIENSKDIAAYNDYYKGMVKTNNLTNKEIAIKERSLRDAKNYASKSNSIFGNNINSLTRSFETINSAKFGSNALSSIARIDPMSINMMSMALGQTMTTVLQPIVNVFDKISGFLFKNAMSYEKLAHTIRLRDEDKDNYSNEDIEKTIAQLAKETGVNNRVIATSMEKIVEINKSPMTKEHLGLTSATAKATNLYGGDAGALSETILGIQNVFGNELPYLFNVLSKVKTEGRIEYDEIAKYSANAIQISKHLQVPFEEFFAYSGKMSTQLGGFPRLATEWSNITSALLVDNKEIEKKFANEVGMSTKELLRQSGSIGQYFKNLQNLSIENGFEKDKFAMDLYGPNIRTSTLYVKMIENADEISAYTKELQNLNRDNYNIDKEFKEGLESDQMSFEFELNKLISLLTGEVGMKILSIANKFLQIINSIPEEVLVAMVTNFLILGAVTKFVIMPLLQFIMVILTIAGLISLFTSFPAIIAGIVAGVGTLVGAITAGIGVIATTLGVSMTVATGGLILVLGGLAWLLFSSSEAAQKCRDAIGSFFSTLWSAIKQFVELIWNVLKSLVTIAMKILQPLFNPIGFIRDLSNGTYFTSGFGENGNTYNNTRNVNINNNFNLNESDNYSLFNNRLNRQLIMNY